MAAGFDPFSIGARRAERDCYLLHWRRPKPLKETVAGFEQLQRDGKIRSWGVSNFDVPYLEAMWELAAPGRIACNQVLYYRSLRAIEHFVLPWCEEHGVSVVGYSPLGSGRFPAPLSRRGSCSGASTSRWRHARGVAERGAVPLRRRLRPAEIPKRLGRP